MTILLIGVWMVVGLICMIPSRILGSIVLAGVALYFWQYVLITLFWIAVFFIFCIVWSLIPDPSEKENA